VPAYDQELNAAISIAQEAGKIALGYFLGGDVGARVKGVRDVVTAADLESEECARSLLAEAFPRDGLVAEEGSVRTGSSGRRWYVDPLDGTYNFSRGIPFWCVSVSLFANEQPVVGVVHDPVRRETFSGSAGSGASEGERRLATTDRARLDDAVVHITVDFDNVEMQQGLTDLCAVSPRVLKTRNLGSAALAMAYVACGRLDAMVHRRANTWDFGAGALLIREAGGIVTDPAGTQYEEGTTAILTAASAALHASLLDLLRGTGVSPLK
jgi:myo-inositol-1(or 4)-monophosphatase